MTHNHPPGSDSAGTFGADDRNLFGEYGLLILRGVDENYVFEFNRSGVIDAPDVYDYGYIQNLRTKELAEACGWGYRRWSR